ncbi:hypothetical protein ACHAXA_006957, partial [Cyclostephanos tholiformis]
DRLFETYIAAPAAPEPIVGFKIMTRRLASALVGLIACSASTMLLLLSTSFSTRDDAKWTGGGHDTTPPPHGEDAEYDYITGSGAPYHPIDEFRIIGRYDEWSGGRIGSNDGLNESMVLGGEAGGANKARKGGKADSDDDPRRPKKRPKGEKWHGWDGHFHGTQPPKNEWWRNSNNCFAVDNICHRRKDNEWFYYPRRSGGDPFQPNMELKSAPAKYDGGTNSGERRISIKVSSSSILEPTEISYEEDGNAFVENDSNKTRCQISSRRHVVVQSMFNDMIGEFYSRSLLGLYRIMKEGADANRTNDGILPWEEDIQFYAHIAYGNKIMLDGHKLLLSGMLSNPDSPPPKSFLDLFVPTGVEHDSDDCQCYDKMVFCGYDVYTHHNNVLSKDLEPAVDVEDSYEINASVNRSFKYDPTTKYTLWSSNSIDGGVDMAICGRSNILDGGEYACQEWNGLRSHLGANVLRHYSTLEGDIANKRREYLLKIGFIDKDYSGNTKEFTVIGLTQRTYRRSWINLPDILEKCNAAAFERVICVEVNVEKTSSPFEQLILHRSLDVMIGVHGAQLTQAVLLPPHAHVLELLPWITDYIRGDWVRTTHVVTPLGVIFHNTDLNHLGYSLDRSSVPLCEGVPQDQEESCFLRRRKQFIWDNRDFIVESGIILRYIEKFVLLVRGKERTCNELKDALDDRFVIYNTWCVKPNYWFPGSWEGVKDCIYGSGYPIDHTDSAKKDAYLFDEREACCAAYQLLCQSETHDLQQSPQNTTLSLWHNYHPRTKRAKKRKMKSNILADQSFVQT